MPKEQSFLADFREDAEKIMEQYELRDCMMALLADAKTGEILACVDLGGTDADRTATYEFEPGSLFKVFSISSFMFLLWAK